ncbi:hypothetical protein BDL97_01G038400 [Sphagnum fallax]|nr:hypothetical protein BDL97_01G038400 [Sphagnum fallax]
MFYDLSLGYEGVEDQTRREVVAMALQLGYTGVAANHMLTGIMADSDRSRIKPLELESVIAAAPGVAEAAKFHRKLLKVPAAQPFRQFSRITVVVEDTVQAAALNSANPVLRSYDIVAARPKNQKAFNQACTHLEVDLISVDFSQRLPFRLKAPMVNAALKRGVFFEVSYGHALFDPRARRELFGQTQTLQAMTRGHGVVLSSGARQAMELRGPNDVINMGTLFGLSVEFAKAAVSKNCESVVLHGVARKKTYKAAILIEHLPMNENPVSDKNLFDVPSFWDPLSVGTTDGASVNLTNFLENNHLTTMQDYMVPELDRKLDQSPVQNLGQQGTPKKVGQTKQDDKTGDLKKNSAKINTPKDLNLRSEDGFISMGSEWTQVSKKGKKRNHKGQKVSDLAFTIDRPHLEASKKRKVS